MENDPAYGWGSDTIWLTVDSWTPEGSSFTGYGIEIDPATENYEKLYYNPYGKYVDFKKGIPEGDFDLIFRSVTDQLGTCLSNSPSWKKPATSASPAPAKVAARIPSAASHRPAPTPCRNTSGRCCRISGKIAKFADI